METLAGPRRLRRLLDAVVGIGSDLDLEAMLRRIIEAATELVDARYGALGVLDESGTRLAQFITVGMDGGQREKIGPLPEGHGILGVLIVDARPLRLPDLTEHPDSFGFPPGHPPMRSFLGVPIMMRDTVFGNLYLTDKTTAEVFTDIDEELVVALAGAAGVAIENARLQARLRDMAMQEDRGRIARDLHDTVIQRLFATGLTLQATVPLVTDQVAAERVHEAVDDLDLTIKHIRSAIFGLESTRLVPGGLRDRVAGLCEEAHRPLGFAPRLFFDGAVDNAVPAEAEEDLLAVLREALSNVARHAQATRVDVTVVEDRGIVLRVADDGRGLTATSEGQGRGRRNMAERAARHGGTCEVVAGEPSGTVVECHIPKA